MAPVAMERAMAMQRASETAGATPIRAPQDEATTDFPVREYISAMALGRLLESAAALAGEPLRRSGAQRAEPGRRRPA